MSAAAPASLRERYAAWSLDAVAVGAFATLLTWTRLVDGWQASTLATTQLLATVRARLFDVLASGATPDAASTALMRDPTVVATATALQSALGSMLLTWLLAYAALAALWHIGGERSRWQGSPGKHALQLRVVDVDGDRQPTLGQSLLRHVGGALSWLSLNLGHALAALPPQRRALHDYLAHSRVVSDGDGRLPAWARAWLWLQVLAVVFAIAWLLQREFAALHASLDA